MGSRSLKGTMMFLVLSFLAQGIAGAQATPATPAAPAVPTAAPTPAYTGPSISGFIDSSYDYNFAGNLAMTNPLRSFDAAANTFLLNDVQLKATGTVSKETSYTVKTDFGTDAAVIHSGPSFSASTSKVSYLDGSTGPDPNNPGNLIYLTQTANVVTGTSGIPAVAVEVEEAYLTYSPANLSGLSITVGKFVTYEGIEVIESGANPTISRGLLFGLAEAYTHTGIKFAYTVNSMITVGAGLVNGWDLFIDNNSGKTGIGQVQLSWGDPLFVSIQGSYGPEQASSVDPAQLNQRSSIDLVAVTKVLPMTTLNLQANYGQENWPTALSTWRGVGVQPVIALNSSWSLGVRYEQFVNDAGDRMGGVATEANSFTVAPTWAMASNLVARAEYRYDQTAGPAGGNIFVDTAGMPKNDASTASLEFIQSF